jgi:hypothetical protein
VNEPKFHDEMIKLFFNYISTFFEAIKEKEFNTLEETSTMSVKRR